ncbi:MAG: class I SAM-dependent methyltransferase [Fimbriimonadaceae bacterium]
MGNSFLYPDHLGDYILNHWVREPEIMRELRELTALREDSGYQISPDEAQFLAFMTRAISATRYLEIGVFTGYSSLAVALAMPVTGKITACDISEEFTAIGRKFWERAGVSEKIELRIAPAMDTLQDLINEGREYDFAFIDADKPNYAHYYEACLKLVRKGGLIAVDNVLWGGKVTDPSFQDESTIAIRELNSFIQQDERVEVCLVPIGDGVTLTQRR